MKYIFLLLTLLITLFSSTPVSAHGVLASEQQKVGNYTIQFEATADAPAIYANYAVTYDFRLYDKTGEKEMPYDSSYIFVSRKDDRLIVQTETPAPRDFLPGSQITVAVPEPGEYKMEVIFNIKDAKGESQEVKTTFPFTAVAGEVGDGLPVPQQASSSTSLTLVWGGIGLFVVAFVLGRFSNRFSKRT